MLSPKEKEYLWEDIVRVSDTGGYASPWGDGVSWEVVFCPTCSYEMFHEYATILGGERL